ncbi:MAG: serpin family protein [Myxococcota bacterium]
MSLSLLGCPAPAPPPPPPPPTPPGAPVTPAPPTAPGAVAPATEVDPASSDAESSDAMALGVELYRRAGRDEQNVVISPMSIQMALAMAYGGARGETATEMANVLGFGPDIHTQMGDRLGRYEAPSSDTRPFALEVANRVYTDRQLTLAPAFTTLTRDRYRAEAEAVDFRGAADAARKSINGWVKGKTRDKIPALLPPGSVDTDTRMVLTNAVYFKGDWRQPFEKSSTASLPFRLADGGDKKVPMMRQTANLRYAETDGLQLLEMGYRGGGWSMVFALPRTVDGLSDLEGRLEAQSLRGWREAMRAKSVRVTLPKFELKPGEPMRLSGALRAMGMTRAFDASRADFSGIAEATAGERLVISEVFHKAFVKLDEKGTEAAAATAVGIKATSLPMEPVTPVDFTADRPFMFFLVDADTGAPMFFGRVLDPSA